VNKENIFLDNSLFFKLVKKAEKKNLELSQDNNTINIKSEDLDSFFKILFRFCSRNKFCFSIFKNEFDFFTIEIYNTKEIESFFIKVQYSYDISKEKMKFNKEFTKYKKRRIYPIVGPDGVGKTTLLTSAIDIKQKNILYKRFKKIVRRSIIYNLMYPINRFFLKRKLGKKPEKDQHDDVHYFLILLAGIFYYPYLVFNSRFKNKVVFVDRFFNDYLLENISFLDKKTILRKNWNKLLSIIPTVFWTIHLDAKPKTILSRKDELLKRDVKKYKKYNFKIYLAKPSFVYTYINTDLELDDCKLFLEHTYKKVLEK